MTPDDVELLLQQTRGSLPPPSLELRVLEAARRNQEAHRSIARPSWMFAAAAILVFAGVSAAILLTGTDRRPWIYERRELHPRTRQEDVVFSIVAQNTEGYVAGRPQDIERVVATLIPETSGEDSKGEPILLHSDRGHLDPRTSVLTLSGSIALIRENGIRQPCFQARIDNSRKNLTIGWGDLPQDAPGGRAASPKTELTARQATSYQEGGKSITLMTGPVTVKIHPTPRDGAAKAFSAVVTARSARVEQLLEPRGPENRSMKIFFSEDVEVKLDEGPALRGNEALWDEAQRTLTIQIKIK
jgi:hypothetical protein